MISDMDIRVLGLGQHHTLHSIVSQNWGEGKNVNRSKYATCVVGQNVGYTLDWALLIVLETHDAY